jgi:hypothetical protein
MYKTCFIRYLYQKDTFFTQNTIKTPFYRVLILYQRFIHFNRSIDHPGGDPPQNIPFPPPDPKTPFLPPPGGAPPGGTRGEPGGTRGGFPKTRCTNPSEKKSGFYENFTKMIQKPNFHQNFTGPGILINVFSGWDGHPPFSPNFRKKLGFPPRARGYLVRPRGISTGKYISAGSPRDSETKKHILCFTIPRNILFWQLMFHVITTQC